MLYSITSETFKTPVPAVPLQIEKRPPVHADVTTRNFETAELRTGCLSSAEFDSERQKCEREYICIYLQCCLQNSNLLQFQLMIIAVFNFKVAYLFSF